MHFNVIHDSGVICCFKFVNDRVTRFLQVTSDLRYGQHIVVLTPVFGYNDQLAQLIKEHIETAISPCGRTQQ